MSTQYAKLYPQNGDRLVTIDSVTSFHPMYMLKLIMDTWKLDDAVAS